MVSQKFIEECKEGAYNNRLGTIEILNSDTKFTESDNLQSFEIDSGCVVDGSIIGSVYGKKLTATLVDALDANLVEKSINAKVGVKYDDDSIDYVNLGNYDIEKPKDEVTADLSSITAYDKLLTKIDDPYICNLDFENGKKYTLADLYVDVCNQLGLKPKTTSFLNSEYEIIGNPFTNNGKNRLVLQTISKIACSYVLIDDNNEIDLCWLSQSTEPDYTFTLDDYSTLVSGNITIGPINSLIIKNSQIDDENVSISDEESIEKYGENQLIISEDYFLTNSDERRKVLNNIWNRVHGLTYADCELTTYYGKPFLKIGSKVRIYKDEENYFDTYVLQHTFKYDGAFESTIKSPVLTKQEISTKQDISLGEKLKLTEIEIDKINQKIASTIKKVEDITETVEYFKVDIQSSSVIVPVDENNLPIENKYYDIPYEVFYLGKKVNKKPTTDNTFPGIEVEYVDDFIRFFIKKSQKIDELDNIFTFNWEYKDEDTEQEYSINRLISLSLAKQGIKGIDGTNGKGIVSTSITYQASDSGTIKPTGNWVETIPEVADEKYLWTRTNITYTDETTTESFSVSKMGKSGSDGVGISSSIIEWQVGFSGTTPPTGEWTETIPSVSAGQYLWQKNTTTYTNKETKIFYTPTGFGDDGIIESDTPPEDTNQLWLDTNSGELKRYRVDERDEKKEKKWISIDEDLYSQISEIKDDITATSTKVDEFRQTTEGLEANVSKIISGETAVASVKSTTVSITAEEGLKVGTTESGFNASLNATEKESGLFLKDGTTEIANFTTEGTTTTNLNEKGTRKYQYDDGNFKMLSKATKIKYKGNSVSAYVHYKIR